MLIGISDIRPIRRKRERAGQTVSAISEGPTNRKGNATTVIELTKSGAELNKRALESSNNVISGRCLLAGLFMEPRGKLARPSDALAKMDSLSLSLSAISTYMQKCLSLL